MKDLSPRLKQAILLRWFEQTFDCAVILTEGDVPFIEEWGVYGEEGDGFGDRELRETLECGRDVRLLCEKRVIVEPIP